ncbi:MAG TPA: hypothetical protein DD490_18770, partial [Acidobacteria bacterium]|nr:hypothetical protein [Acidobacteriota bacterium]
DAERAAAQAASAGAGLQRERRDAIPLLEEALRQWKAAGEVRSQIDTLNELGVLKLSLADVAPARDAFQAALTLAREIGDPRWQALSSSNLATAFLALGQTAQTQAFYEQALDLWKQLGDAVGQGRALYGLGVLYRDREDLDQALRHLSAALAMRRQAGDVEGELVTLLALAGVHQARGEKEEALACRDRALALSRAPGGGGSEASIFQTMASLQRHGGDLGEAVASLQQALAIYHRSGDDQMEARALYNLGSLYQDLGALDEAQRSYERALELFGGQNPEVEVRLLNAIGWILYLKGDVRGGIGSYDRALALARREGISSGIAQALGFTGIAYVSLGRSKEGLDLLLEELALRRKNSDRSGEARSLLAIGTAWQALGVLDKAEAAFQDALLLGRQVGDHGLEATCLYRRARLDRQRGDLPQALARVREALEMIESVRSRVTSEKLRVTFLASKRAWYELYVDLLLRREAEEPGRGYAAEALHVSERARARGLLDLIAEGRIDVQEGVAADLKQRESELGARLSWIQERLGDVLAGGSESSRAGDLRAQLDRVGEEMEDLEDEIRRRHPRYAEVRYPTPLHLEQVQALLDERTALLETFVGEEASYLFTVTRTGLSVHRLPPAAELERKVQEIRSTLEKPGILTFGRFLKAAGDLYATLLGPVAARLAGTPHLLISPDGPLSLFPFEALLTHPGQGRSYKDLPYLVRDHAISYVPSASVLGGLREPRADSRPPHPAPKDLVAFGDPVYPAGEPAAAPARGSLATWAAPPLAGTEREVQAIAALYPPTAVELYLREAATEDNVKSNPLIQTARRIHFATHGFVDEARPQLSGLLLARDARSPQDGLLQVYEIFNLRLQADLVTLSACETALGEQVTGEGMVGLTRAFLYAGADSLLVSLWPVSDRSTPDLMTGFYRHLRDLRPKAVALQQAKLERIGAGDEPYRWAPFILAGDPH